MTAIEIGDAPVYAACACVDLEGRFNWEGKSYAGQFSGSISVRVDPLEPGQSARSKLYIPLHIVGYTTTSVIDGLGRVTLDFDFSREIAPSSLEGRDEKNFFPGAQLMRLNILMRADALGDAVLQSRNEGVLLNNDARAFPPLEGATYILQEPVELGGRERPEETIMTLDSVNTSIVSTELPASVIRVDSTVVLRVPEDGADWIIRDASDQATIILDLEQAGHVEIVVEDAAGMRTRSMIYENLAAGSHFLEIDLSGLTQTRYYYRLFIDGAPRTARMVLVYR
jgi:hypothetical protein